MDGQNKNYHDYLQLERLLDCQVLQSQIEGNGFHDEMLFIIVHQSHELWFKQVLFELDAIILDFSSNRVDDRQMGVILARLERMEKIMQMQTQQLKILETMTPLDFLEFRDYLRPSSGFQSLQFRLLENKLGLSEDVRLSYGNRPTCSYLKQSQQLAYQKALENPNLFSLVEKWLERTPFIESDNFNFWSIYRQAVQRTFDRDLEIVEGRSNSHERALTPHLAALFDQEQYTCLLKAKERRLSYAATQAALFIHLYRDEPLLHLPYRLLNALVDLDESMFLWRSTHVQLVLRTIGQRPGTGGSTGASYLSKTLDDHRIFSDFVELASYMIPRSSLPPLPAELGTKLGFKAIC